MEIAIKSDVGQRRTLNEDAAGYFLNTQNVPLIVVCDGIGGHNAGDVASAMALSHLGKRWEEEVLRIQKRPTNGWLKIFRLKMIVSFRKQTNIVNWMGWGRQLLQQ